MFRAISDSAARTLPSRVPEFLAGWKTLAVSAFVDMSTIKYRQWVQTDVPGDQLSRDGRIKVPIEPPNGLRPT